MFGKIISIDDNFVKVENLKKDNEINILNYHVVFCEENRKIVGEISAINYDFITVLLVGEIIADEFIAGIIKKPGLNSTIRLVYKSEVEMILGNQDISNKNVLSLGKSTIYESFNVTASVNDFFSGHFAIIGNTGSGKSCGVARIIQNVFTLNDGVMPTNSHFVIFDIYGEYNQAFTDLNNLPGINTKFYTSKVENIDNNLIKIPPYFLNTDDLALLLNVNDPSLLPIIDKSLQLVYILISKDTNASKYMNNIIAKSLLDILSSGKNATQIRDQLVAVLTQFNTEDLNLNTAINQPGYSRTLKQCLNIDTQGKMNAVQYVVELLEQFAEIKLDNLIIDQNVSYTLEDLYKAFELALISEGTFQNSNLFNSANMLKVRLNAIINSPTHEYFKYSELISKDNYIKKMFTDDKGDKVQIINMNFNYIEERLAKVLTKIFSKLFFNYNARIDERTKFPIHIILEEAHRYVQNDNDVNVIGYNIFDRITKEGRKYGTLLGLITQRPSELSNTALSQCTNFIVFRMYHPDDINIISKISSNISFEAIEKLKVLRPGSAIVFGTSFKIPLIIKLDLPSPMPISSSVKIDKIWYE